MYALVCAYMYQGMMIPGEPDAFIRGGIGIRYAP
jgi:hypothetical protein